MTNSINQNINPYPQSLTGINNASLPNVDTDKIKQGVNNSPVAKVADQKNPKLMFWVFLPTWLLTHLGMNAFSKACRGDYENSLMGKIEKRTTKMESITNPTTKMVERVDNSIFAKTDRQINKIKNFLKNKIIMKNKILKSMFITPAIPENKNVLMMSSGIRSEIASSAVGIFEKFTNNGTDIEKIKKLGFNKKDKLGKIILDEFGKEITDVDKYKEVVKNPSKYRTKIMNICKAQGNNAAEAIDGGIPLSKWFNRKFRGQDKETTVAELFPKSDFINKLFRKEVHFSEFANKMRGAKGGVTKTTLRIIEGFTNATTAGGILGSLMGAYIIADAIVRSINAPKGKGEKRKTFAENMLYNLGFYLTMPLAIKTMFGIGGLQYIGMDKKEVQNYRKALAEFNKKAKAGEFTKAEYIAAKKELKTMLKGKTRILAEDKRLTNVGKFFKNIIHRPLKKIANIFMVGTETRRAFITKDSSKFKKFAANLGFNLKDYASYPVRMLAFILIFAPFFAKFFAKGSHLVFGKPAKSILDEGKEEKEKEKAEKLAKAQQTPMAATSTQQTGNLIAAATAKNLAQNQANSMKKENLIDIYKTKPNSQVAMTSYIPSSQSLIPADEDKPIKKENLLDMYKSNPPEKKEMMAPTEPVRTYVPSTQAVKIPPGSNKELFDKEIPELNHAVTKAERAEKEAHKYVK